MLPPMTVWERKGLQETQLSCWILAFSSSFFHSAVSYQRLILQQSQKCAVFPLSPLTILSQDQAKELFKDFEKEGL